KMDDALSAQLSDDPPSVTASKAGEFIPSIFIAAPKRLSIQSRKSLAPRKPLSKKGDVCGCQKDFNSKFYNSLGSVPNRCSVV
ncbi:hypothetical protein Tco_0457339, partial [Tanacetum coccineum]